MATGKVIAVRTMPNVVLRDGPYPHFDVERIWEWLLAGLTAFAGDAPIEAISTTTHACAFALLGRDGLVLPVLDYEYEGPEAVRAEYDRARGDFAETLSPNLPNGLNGGRQLYWQARAFPEAYARVEAILPYAQYWPWRLTGERASEVTSIACHCDLWNPRLHVYSRLAEREGWSRLFPPMVKAWDTVGTLKPDIAARTGIARDCRVVAGIHDSNASLLPHLLSRPQPFAVLSTGTWLIEFAPGGPLDSLDPTRDCLANVDAFGRPVPSSRFMGGREFEILAGDGAEPAAADVARVVGEKVMALPTFTPGIGPFGRGKGRWTHDPQSLSPEERTAAASLYCALVATTCLDLTGAAGPVVVEGPFSRNRVFLGALAQLIHRPVIARPDATGTTEGAALLALGPDARPGAGVDTPAPPLDVDISAYARTWRGQAEEG